MAHRLSPEASHSWTASGSGLPSKAGASKARTGSSTLSLTGSGCWLDILISAVAVTICDPASAASQPETIVILYRIDDENDVLILNVVHGETLFQDRCYCRHHGNRIPLIPEHALDALLPSTYVCAFSVRVIRYSHCS